MHSPTHKHNQNKYTNIMKNEKQGFKLVSVIIVLIFSSSKTYWCANTLLPLSLGSTHCASWPRYFRLLNSSWQPLSFPRKNNFFSLLPHIFSWFEKTLPCLQGCSMQENFSFILAHWLNKELNHHCFL